MNRAQEELIVRELRRRKKDQVCQDAVDLIEELRERVAIKFEGRVLVDGGELAKEFILLSASVGGMTGPQVLEKVEKILTEAKRIW